jgi:hypothetical protein
VAGVIVVEPEGARREGAHNDSYPDNPSSAKTPRSGTTCLLLC